MAHLGYRAPQHGADAGLFAGLDHGRAGAVAGQHAGGAVAPVGDLGHLVGADDQGAGGGAGADRVVGGGQGVGEAGADDVDVHDGGAAAHAQLGRDTGGHVGGTVDRGGRGHEDEVDVVGGESGVREGLARGLEGQLVDRLLGSRHVARLDADPGSDPLVVGVDHGREVLVGDHFRGLVVP